MEKEINVLEERNKGACMGRDAIHYIMDKVKDEGLKKELDNQYKEYQKILDKIGKVYPEYSEKEPHETNAMNKAMTWSGIEMKTMTDKSNSKIAELLLQGVNMGIIEGRRILNKKKINKEVESIVSNYVTMQEKSMETLKKFL